MRILVVDVDRDLQWSFATNQKHIDIGSSAQNDLIVDGIASKQIRLENNRGTITITNYVSGATRLLDIELLVGTSHKYVWRPNQELYLSDYVILLLQEEADVDKKTRPGLRTYFATSPLTILAEVAKAAIPFLILLAALFVLGALVYRTRDTAAQTEPIVYTTPAEIPTATPTVVPIAIPVTTPVPVIPKVAAIDRPLTPTSAVPPTVEPSPTATPELVTAAGRPNWQPSTLEADLGLSFQPAQGRKGVTYWRLVTVIWLDESAAGGRHGIYFDVRDEQHHSVPEAKTIVSWGSGSCVRYMPKRPELHNLGTDDNDFNNYHINCPMFSAGNVYTTRVDGISDQLIGLGLGTKQERNLPLLTSFLLVFERDVLR